jgi:hemerythrin-like domain-containing protein
MSSIKHTMAADHKHCDDLFMQAEGLAAKNNWQPARQPFEKFTESMHRHFEHEEKVLFPAFELAGGGSSGPTMMMRHEHENMRQLMDDMHQALVNENRDRYLGLSETLLIFMQQHNLKEEQILYPMIDSHCAEQAEQLMNSFIDATNTSDAA